MTIENANDHPFKVTLVNGAEGVLYANSHPYKVILEGGKIGYEAVIVDELPETGDSNTIYFILKESTPDGDIYDEWMWMLQPDDTYDWTHIGTTDTVEIKLYSTTGQHTDGAMTQKAVTNALPTKTSDLINDGADGTSTYAEADGLSAVATSGSYTDLLDTPTIGDATVTIQKNGTTAGTFKANATVDKSINITVPTKTSDLSNDSNFVVDANYVHTDNNFDNTAKNKLASIAGGAEVNVQSDWNETNTEDDAYIKNKPTIPTYTAGTGLNLVGTEFSVDESVIPTLDDVAKKAITGETAPTTSTEGEIGQLYVQDDGTVYILKDIVEESGEPDEYIWEEAGVTYTAGTDIDITDNVISATNIGKAKVITTADYNWDSDNDNVADKVAVWLLPDGTYSVNNNPVVYLSTSYSMANATIVKTTNSWGTPGALVVGNASNGTAQIYALKDDGSSYSWRQIIDSTMVKSNLTTTVQGYALDASQGKALKDMIDAIVSFSYEVVSVLPQQGQPGKIYLLPIDESGDESGVTDNYYEEYIWITEGQSGRWELIGTTKIDLSDYVTNEELATTLLDYAKSADLPFKTLSTADYDWNTTAGDDETEPFDAIALWKLEPGYYMADESVTVVPSNDKRGYITEDCSLIVGGEYAIAGRIVRNLLWNSGMGWAVATTDINNGYPFIASAGLLTTSDLGEYQLINISDYNWNSQTKTETDPDCFALWRYTLSTVPRTYAIIQPSTKVQEYKDGPLMQMDSPTIYMRSAEAGGTSLTHFAFKIDNQGVYRIAFTAGGDLVTYDTLATTSQLAQTGSTAPTTSTVGEIGQLYVKSDGTVYILKNIVEESGQPNEYQWDTIGSTYTAGTNVQISNQNVISATDTTYSAFTGTDGTAAGTSGLVPAPATTDAGKFLKADGTWETVQAGGDVTIFYMSGGLIGWGEDEEGPLFYKDSSYQTPATASEIYAACMAGPTYICSNQSDDLYYTEIVAMSNYDTNYNFSLTNIEHGLGYDCTIGSYISGGTEYYSFYYNEPSSINVVQSTGTSQADVMSQMATTSMIFNDPSTRNQISIGRVASISGANTIAMGRGSRATEAQAIAIGGANNGNTQATGSNAIAIGSKSSATGAHSIALGDEASATIAGQFDIGLSQNAFGYNNSHYRLLTGLYDGQSAHDAATVGQLNGKVLTNAGAPTTSTVGTVGQILEDTTNGKLYICTAIVPGTAPNPDTYTWEEVGGNYTLPIASASTLGGVKIGTDLVIDASTGVLSATNTGKIRRLSTADYNHHASGDTDDGIGIWKLPEGLYFSPYLKVYWNPISSNLNLNALILVGGNDGAIYRTVTVFDTLGDITSFIINGETGQQQLGDYSTGVLVGKRTGYGAPSTGTKGKVGQIWEDSTNHVLYICKQASGGTYTWEEIGGDTITVDTEMSSTSTNPVQNRVIYAEIGQLDSVLARLTTGTGIGGGN